MSTNIPKKFTTIIPISLRKESQSYLWASRGIRANFFVIDENAIQLTTGYINGQNVFFLRKPSGERIISISNPGILRQDEFEWLQNRIQEYEEFDNLIDMAASGSGSDMEAIVVYSTILGMSNLKSTMHPRKLFERIRDFTYDPLNLLSKPWVD